MNQEILNLKAEGKSLREISKILGISHVAVGKRLKKLLTRNTPPIDTDQGVNSSCGLGETRPDALKDLTRAIIDFLEERGLKVYSMRTEGEAYQVKYNGQVVRFYVQRSDVSDKSH